MCEHNGRSLRLVTPPASHAPRRTLQMVYVGEPMDVEAVLAAGIGEHGETTVPRRLITLEEAARRLSLDARFAKPLRVVERLIKRGDLIAVYIGKHRFIAAGSVDRLARWAGPDSAASD